LITFEDIVFEGGNIPETVKASLTAARRIYYHAALHIKGVLPPYRNNGNGYYLERNYISPEFIALVDEKIFATHPFIDEKNRDIQRLQLKPIMSQAASGQIQRYSAIMFSSGNFEVRFETPTTNAYFKAKNFQGQDFLTWCEGSLLRRIITDPNGYLLVVPNDIGTFENPKVEYIPSISIIYFSEDLVVTKTNNTYFGADKLFYYETNEDNEIIIRPHYLNRLPFVQLGGIPNVVEIYDKRNRVTRSGIATYYDSFFYGFLALADDTMSNYAVMQLLSRLYGYPIKEETILECDECNGIGIVTAACGCDDTPNCTTCNGTNTKYVTCKKCNGTKYLQRNPTDVYRTPAPRGDLPKHDIVKFYQPPTDSLDFIQKQFEQSFERARQSIFIQRSDVAQSGIAKREDRKDESVFLSSLSKQVFGVLQSVAEIVAAFLEFETANKVILGEEVSGIFPTFGTVFVTPPANFDLRDTDELLSAYNDAIKTRENYTINLARRAYLSLSNGGSEAAIKTNQILDHLDIFGLRNRTIQEKMLLVTSGIVPQNKMGYYEALPNIVERVIIEQGEQWFTNATFAEIEAQTLIEWTKTQPK